MPLRVVLAGVLGAAFLAAVFFLTRWRRRREDADRLEWHHRRGCGGADLPPDAVD